MHINAQRSGEPIAMDALIDDRDVLLLARSKELQEEYDNLVRSLDAAYDAVRQINAAMSVNRSEAKRVFQERLELLTSRPKRQDVICNPRVDESIIVNRGSDGVTGKPRTLLVTGTRDKVARYVIALAAGKHKGILKTTSLASAQNNSSRSASEETPKLIYYTQQKNTSQRVYTKGYVDDEHSYAEVDTKTGLLDCHSVTHQEENTEKQAETENEVDLSIVKSELDEESSDWDAKQNSVADDLVAPKEQSASDFGTTLPAVTIATMPKLKVVQQEPYEHKVMARRRNKPTEKQADEEAIKRKRVMTRNRMRRWRAKKRLEQMSTAVGNGHKYLGL